MTNARFLKFKKNVRSGIFASSFRCWISRVSRYLRHQLHTYSYFIPFKGGCDPSRFRFYEFSMKRILISHKRPERLFNIFPQGQEIPRILKNTKKVTPVAYLGNSADPWDKIALIVFAKLKYLSFKTGPSKNIENLRRR